MCYDMCYVCDIPPVTAQARYTRHDTQEGMLVGAKLFCKLPLLFDAYVLASLVWTVMLQKDKNTHTIPTSVLKN